MCVSQSTRHSFLLGPIYFFPSVAAQITTRRRSLQEQWLMELKKVSIFQFRRHFLTNKIYARHYEKYLHIWVFYIQSLSRSREIVTFFMMFHLVICNVSYTKLLSSRKIVSYGSKIFPTCNFQGNTVDEKLISFSEHKLFVAFAVLMLHKPIFLESQFATARKRILA